jgi:sugar/nucleoside kinase (ribokinase family)
LAPERIAMSHSPDLVILGNLLVDDIVYADGRTRMAEAGGAALHAAFAATLWGAPTGLVCPLGDDYPAAALDALRSRGVRLKGLTPLHGPGVRAWILYEPGGRRIVHRLGCPSHEAASPTFAQIPREWLGARAFHLAPMPLVRQAALVQELRAHVAPEVFISVDPHHPVTPETLPQWRRVLEHVDAFFPSEDEWRLGEAAADARQALASLAGGRLRYVLHKRAARGGTLYDAASGATYHWPPRAEAIIDPTGAGDAFAMGFVTAMVSGSDMKQALARARVSASFALEGWGSEGLARATPAAAQARLAAWAAQESAT